MSKLGPGVRPVNGWRVGRESAIDWNLLRRQICRRGTGPQLRFRCAPCRCKAHERAFAEDLRCVRMRWSREPAEKWRFYGRTGKGCDPVRLFRKPVSDAEYIEQLRKKLRVERWMRLFHAAIGLAILLLGAKLIQLVLQVLMNFGGPAQQNVVIGVFSAAAVMGLCAGLMLSKAAQSFAFTLFESRSDRMLVELWDALAAHLKECRPADSLEPLASDEAVSHAEDS